MTFFPFMISGIETYCSNISNDKSNTLCSLQTKMGKEGSNGGCSREFHGLRNELGDGVTGAGDGKDEEDSTFNHYGSNSRAKGDITSTSPSDNVVAEVVCRILCMPHKQNSKC